MFVVPSACAGCVVALLAVTRSPTLPFSRAGAAVMEEAAIADDGGNWAKKLVELQAYKAEWGTADATPETPLGKWCAKQRILRADGVLSEDRERELAKLDFSWSSPSSFDAMERCDWDEMCKRLAAYVDENGHGQVPKKLKTDPELGGWVASVRRSQGNGLTAARRAQLDDIGFEWVSVRQCGSSFMKSFRELRSYWEAHGTAEVDLGAVGSDDVALRETAALAKWCDAQRSANAKGLLPPERVAYLDGINFRWS